MARNQDARVVARTMPEIIADAMAILREDGSEYAFIGLAGGATAGIVVLLLGLIGGPIATAGIAPLLIAVAVGTLATSSAAVGTGVNRLQPDASRAFAEAGRHGVAIMRPWLPLAIALGAASYAGGCLGEAHGSGASRRGRCSPSSRSARPTPCRGASAAPQCSSTTSRYPKQ